MHAVLVIEGSPGETADHADNGSIQNDERGSVFEVVLMKGIAGLGMSLVGGTDCGEQYGGMPLISVFKLDLYTLKNPKIQQCCAAHTLFTVVNNRGIYTSENKPRFK